MPTASNKVKFQYIGITVPSTYDNDTIYFDNINHNIKVGSTVIAENNPSDIITSSNIDNYGSFIWDALTNANGSFPLIIDGTGETGDTVYFTMGNFQDFGTLYSSAAKAAFAFAVPRVGDPSDIDDFNFLAEAYVGKIDWTNYTIEMNGIGNGKLYSVILSNVSNQNQMAGTLSVSELIPPVVDEEEF